MVAPGARARATAALSEWDLSSAVALQTGSDAMAAARRLAPPVSEALGDWAEDVAAVAPGFLNVRLSASGWEAVCAHGTAPSGVSGPEVERAWQRCAWLEAMARRERPDLGAPRLSTVPAGARAVLRAVEAVLAEADPDRPAERIERMAAAFNRAYERIPMLCGSDGEVQAWRRIAGAVRRALQPVDGRIPVGFVQA